MKDIDNQTPPAGLQLISPVFREGTPIPEQYSCRGQNVNPPLNIFNVSPSAQSLALIMHDPDAPVGDYVHWIVWDIPKDTETIAANSVPVGAVQGQNSNDESSYMGPCPPAGSGAHRYIFELYALDTSLSLPAETKREQMEEAMKNHILDSTSITGIFAAAS